METPSPSPPTVPDSQPVPDVPEPSPPPLPEPGAPEVPEPEVPDDPDVPAPELPVDDPGAPETSRLTRAPETGARLGGAPVCARGLVRPRLCVSRWSAWFSLSSNDQ